MKKPRHTRSVDPLPLNCPNCGAKLTYVRHDGKNDVYLCANDGVVLNPANGRVYVVTH